MKKGFVNIVIFSAFVYLPIIGVYAANIIGIGPWALSGFELVLLIIPLIELAILFLTLPLLIFRKTRARAKIVMVTILGMAVLFLPSLFVASEMRSFGFFLATKRAVPLVQAIKKFEADNQVPPSSLEQLIPDYIPQMPTRIPPVEIKKAQGFGSNSWMLVSDVSSGILNFDEFIYLPNNDYEKYSFGGSVERIGDWIYVHE